ncbi:MAG: type 4a pilus biogenesis protein PilO [Candidatus Methylomirabilales bacterium]
MDLKGLFANTPKRQLYLLLGIMGVGLAAVWYMYLFTPAQEERNRLAVTKAKLEQDLFQKRRLRDELPKLEKARAELQRDLDKAVRALPEEKEIPNLLTQINRLGQDAGLVFTLFKPGKPKQGEFVTRIPIQIKTEGNYHALGYFFDELSRMERIVNITDLKMDHAKKRRRTSAGDATISGEFTATTFTFGGAPQDAQQGAKRGKKR